MSWQVVLIAISIICVLSYIVYSLIQKVAKYRTLWIDVLRTMLEQKQQHHEEIEYRNLIQNTLEEREKTIIKITENKLTLDELNAIRSGVRPIEPKS